MKWFGALFLTLGAVITGCKPPAQPNSRAESLDNMAGGSWRDACKGGYKSLAKANQIITKQPQIKSEVQQALTAVPEGLQSAFFDAFKGRIFVAPNIPCSGNSISCWKPAADDAIGIYIREGKTPRESVANVRRATVQAFAHVLAEVMLRVKRGAGGTELMENQDLESFENTLAVAFLDRVANSRKYSLQVFKNVLPEEVLAPSLDRQAREAIWQRGQDLAQAKAFRRNALSEGLDSWYCSSETRQNLRTEFQGNAAQPGPYELLRDFAVSLEAAFGGDVRSAEVESPKTNGLALWGRWGAGDGPFRSLFSGWAGFRSEGGGLLNFRRFGSGGGLIGRRNWLNPFRWGDGNRFVEG